MVIVFVLPVSVLVVPLAATTVEAPASIAPVRTLKLLVASGLRPAACAVIVIAPAA